MQNVISGKVIAGDKYGRKLGFPTLNLETKLVEFISGVYAGKGIVGKRIFRAAIIINEVGRVEAYLFGYRGDAYGKVVTLEIKKFLRKYIKFETEAELIKQIKKDIKLC